MPRALIGTAVSIIGIVLISDWRTALGFFLVVAGLYVISKSKIHVEQNWVE